MAKIKSLVELSNDIEEVKLALADLVTPSDKYKANLDIEIAKVAESIKSLNDVINQVRVTLDAHKLQEVTRIQEIGESIQEVLSPEQIVAPGLVQIIPSVTSLKVFWEKLSSADQYEVSFGKNDDSIYNKLALTSNNSVTVPGLTPDTIYNVFIVSKKFNGESSLPSKIFIAQTLKIN